VLICESTYGDTLHESRLSREGMLINEMIKTLRMGGNVLLPVFATGRCHELLLIMDEYW
jgi:Cft2 family RNA processing exonuclease